ncbi:MAG: heavy-metal-associated domain-containing protein [Calditrichia bacterium]
MIVQFKVPDMTCGHCKMTIENSIRRLTSVQRVDIDLNQKIVEVEGTVDREQVQTAIEQAGYTVEDL